MKFLCDRCKTRYSIGDDRVRGKILKIRCKNCANVITVREGMTDEGAAAAAADDVAARRARPTTAAPNVAHTAIDGASKSALGAAFATQMTKPPAALEEEWYVSIDGVQSGPFSLADAQRWVGNKAFDADLHCWSEGFDDWLPVDKVSHFRGLRKKPAPAAAPPPLPRVASGAGRKADDSNPKPLFAATMAALERGVSDPKSTSIASGASTKGVGSTPIGGVVASMQNAGASARANGMHTATPIPSVGKNVVPAKGVVPTRAGTLPGTGKKSASAAALAFDASEQDSGDSFTVVEAPVFGDEVETRAEPVAAKRAGELNDNTTGQRGPNVGMQREVARGAAPSRSPVAPAQPNITPSSLAAEEANLDIGEVSRVVKLADIIKAPRKARPAMRPSAARMSGSNLATSGQADTLIGGPLATDEAPSESTLAPIGSMHRRGMIMLIALAAALLLGGVGAVLLLVTSSADDDDVPIVLGPQKGIDTSRPEDLITGRPGPIGIPTANPTPTPRPRRTCPPFCGSMSNYQPPKEPELPSDPNLRKLDATEVEDYASKQNGGTQRCYMRAQKGVEGILVGDVKKINVTLSIAKDGTVSEVTLSEHSADSLGKCLTGLIKRWKFRESPGGMYRFVLAFASS